MRVASWNLWWRHGPWEDRRSAIARTLRTLNADVVALQEVWHISTENMAESLAADLGYECAFAVSPAPGKWQRRIGDDSVGIGNAVLSRWPIADVHVERLPPGDAPDEGRVALHSWIESPHGALPFVATHLNSGWGHSTIRAEQLRTTAELIRSEGPGDLPPVLCGDFNAAEDFEEIRALTGKRDLLVPDLVLLDAWNFLRPGEMGHTWDRRNPHVDASNEPSARIDYIFVGLADRGGGGKPEACGLFGTEPVEGIWPSDHFGVWVDLGHPSSGS